MSDEEKPERLACLLHGCLKRDCELCEKDAEIATLKRQVDVLVERIAGCCSKCPAKCACDTSDDNAWCEELIKEWSLEQAKKGGAQ